MTARLRLTCDAPRCERSIEGTVGEPAVPEYFDWVQVARKRDVGHLCPTHAKSDWEACL